MDFQLNDYDHRIVHGEAHKAWRKSKTFFRDAGMQLDDVVSAAWEGLLHAQLTHDPTRAPIHPWQGLLARQFIYRELTRCQRGAAIPVDSYDYPDEEPDEHDWELTLQQEVIRDLVIEMANDDKDVSLLLLRFWSPFTYPELVEFTGIPLATCHRRITKAQQKISEALESL